MSRIHNRWIDRQRFYISNWKKRRPVDTFLSTTLDMRTAEIIKSGYFTLVVGPSLMVNTRLQAKVYQEVLVLEAFWLLYLQK
jgi:hypothetical protein